MRRTPIHSPLNHFMTLSVTQIMPMNKRYGINKKKAIPTKRDGFKKFNQYSNLYYFNNIIFLRSEYFPVSTLYIKTPD